MTKLLRGSVASLCAAVSLAGVSAARAQSGAETPPPPSAKTAGALALWRASYVDEKGALPLGATDSAMEYAVAGSFSMTAEGTVRGWTRWEEFSPVDLPEGSARSLTELMEVDCRAGRGRLLALDVYPYNNLKGEPHHVDAPDPQWAYPRPGTVLEQNITTMCAAARSALTAAVMQAQQDGQPTPEPGERSTALASLR